MAIRRVTFRLYPKSFVNKLLHYHRQLHKSLYNAAVYNRKTQYQRFGHSVDYLEQQNCLPAFKEVWTEYKQINSQALQATLKRVDFAFQRFFKGLGKYPRFKSIRHYSGWAYPSGTGWKINTTGKNGYLELAKIGKIQIRGQARNWGHPSTCTIVYRNGKWFASVTVDCLPVRETGIEAIGVDFGTMTAAALSDGTRIENPRFLANTQEKIRKASRAKKRKRSPNFKKKVIGSKRWKKAQKRVAKLVRKAANQRQDWVHQQAAEIVSSHSLVATEELNLKGMTRKSKGKRKRQKTGLNRSILDVGIGMFIQALEYKLVEAGGFLVKVPTLLVKPSQTCPNCGHQHKKELSERVHHCRNCGFTCDRDVAAAMVMLQWALGTSVLKRGSQAPTSAPQATGGWKQAWETKRKKPRPQVNEVS